MIIFWNNLIVYDYCHALCFMLVVKLNLELVGDKGRSSDAHKTPEQMDFKHRPSCGRISSSMKLSDASWRSLSFLWRSISFLWRSLQRWLWRPYNYKRDRNRLQGEVKKRMQPEGGWHVIPKKICTYEEWLNKWRREARKSSLRSPVVVAQLALPGCLPTPMSCHSQGVHLTRQDDMTFRNRVSFCRCITAVQLQEIKKKSQLDIINFQGRMKSEYCAKLSNQ